MIKITGNIHSYSKEMEAAFQIKEKLIKEWPDIEESEDDNISIMISAHLTTGKNREIDLIVTGNFKNPKKIKPRNHEMCTIYPEKRNSKGEVISPAKEISSDEIFIENFFIIIECKKVPPKLLKIENGNLLVKYPDKPFYDNVTEQSSQQLFSLKKHLGNQLYFKKLDSNKRSIPFIFNMIYLQDISDDDKRSGKVKVFQKNHSWADIAQSMISQISDFGRLNPKKYDEKVICSSFDAEHAEYLMGEKYLLSKEFSDLDQIQMARIAKKGTQSWLGHIGKKMLIISGIGGAGKTIRILQLAKQLYEDSSSRILILTYNNALIANIERLLVLSGINSKQSNDKFIKFRTIHSFMGDIINKHGIANISKQNFFEQYKTELLDKLSHDIDLLNESELIEAKGKFNDKAINYVFVDEGQDTDPREAKIIERIFDYKNIVVANGINQEVRETMSFNWESLLPANIDRKESVFKAKAKRARRMKANILSFIKAFATDELNDDEYLNVKAIDDAFGGSIHIIENSNLSDSKQKIDEIINKAKHNSSDNSKILNIDILLLLQDKKDGEDFVNKLKDYDYEVWNAFGKSERRSIPKNTNTLRVVPYTSVRGLEGWSCVLFKFDDFWERAYAKGLDYAKSESSQKSLFKSESESAEEFAKNYAAKWLLIALTRAVDSLIIQIDDRNSYIGKKLYEIHKKSKDYVSWTQN